MNAQRPRILLADDDRRLADEIAALLSEDFDVVAVAHDGLELLKQASVSRPDAVVADIQMPQVDGITASRVLLARWPDMPIVLLTALRDAELTKKALEIGIRGFVLKIAAADDLCLALEEALNGRIFVSSAALTVE